MWISMFHHRVRTTGIRRGRRLVLDLYKMDKLANKAALPPHHLRRLISKLLTMMLLYPPLGHLQKYGLHPQPFFFFPVSILQNKDHCSNPRVQNATILSLNSTVVWIQHISFILIGLCSHSLNIKALFRFQAINNSRRTYERAVVVDVDSGSSICFLFIVVDFCPLACSYFIDYFFRFLFSSENYYLKSGSFLISTTFPSIAEDTLFQCRYIF